jgi:hypothetical protein
VKYDVTSHWMIGVANGYGLVRPPYSNTYWHDGSAELGGVGWGTGITTSLPSGYYKVVESYKWVGTGFFFTPDSPGFVYSQWSAMNGAEYCQIG